MSATRMPYPSAEPVYAAVSKWRDRCLLDNRSFFADIVGSELEDGLALVRDFVEQPDGGKDDFLTKLRGQLGASPTSAVQLAAELLYVHLLVARSNAVSGSRKREIVRRVLGFSPGTAPMPDDLATALDSGLVNPGQAYNSYRWRQFGYLIDFFVAFKTLSTARRREALTDSTAFLEVVDGIDDQGAAIQRHSLEHLLFPDAFPPVVSRDHRATVLKLWADAAGPMSDPEPVRLAHVVESLTPNTTWGSSGFVSLYRSPYVWQWSEPTAAWNCAALWAVRLHQSVDLDAEERDYKIEAIERVRKARAALEVGSDDWVELLKVAFTKENNLVAWQASEPFLAWVKAEPTDAAAALRAFWSEPGSLAIDSFLARVPDSAPNGAGARLSVAAFLLGAAAPEMYPQWRATTVDLAYRLTGFPKPQPTATNGENYDIFLSFIDQFVEIVRRHGLELRDRLDAQGLVWAIINYGGGDDWTDAERSALTSWRSGKGTLPFDPSVIVVGPSDPKPLDVEPVPTPDMDLSLGDLAESLYFDEPFLDEAVQLLRDKSQIIFYGPPGTGKTYVARKLAHWMAGDSERVRLVQFHPSYAYEDFVQGLRPRENEAGFHLVDGPLVELATAASKDPSHNYVLIIDELNRGNVARVLGELYFLLEYRDQPARLLYSHDEFRLPSNLFIIGTMNTADRSIALLDTALRRRFYFVPFRPDLPPVSNVLARYLDKHHPEMSWLASAVDRANGLLEDPAAAIGPSHFMRDDLDETWARRAWEHSVRPTLEDHFFGQEQRLADFEFDVLRAAVNAPDEDPQAS